MDEANSTTESAAPFTFINVFEIDPEAIDTFCEQWIHRSRFMQAADGLIDATLYRAVTGDTRFQLVNVANWTSLTAFQAATSDPDYRKELEQLLSELASSLTVNRGYYARVAGVAGAASKTGQQLSEPKENQP